MNKENLDPVFTRKHIKNLVEQASRLKQENQELRSGIVIEKSPLVQRLQKELQASHDKIASLAKELEVARFESEEYLRQASQVASDLMEQEQRLKALQDSHEAIKQDEVRHLQELEEMTAELKERNAEIGSLRKQRELAEKNVVQMIHCFQVIKGKWKEQVRRTNQLEEENRVLQGHLDENRKMVQSLQQEHRCHQEAAAQVRVSVTQKIEDLKIKFESEMLSLFPFLKDTDR